MWSEESLPWKGLWLLKNRNFSLAFYLFDGAKMYDDRKICFVKRNSLNKKHVNI